MPVVMKLIHYLYNEDVLSEDVIMQWYKQEPASKDASQGHSDIRKQVCVFNHAPGEYSCLAPPTLNNYINKLSYLYI